MVSRGACFALGLSSVAAHAPEKSVHVGGCTPGQCDPGDDFDHWNGGALSGAISKICFKLGSVKAIHDKDWITGGQFCYGGYCVNQGTGADNDCLSLTTDEVITEISGTAGTPRGADHWAVSSIKVTLSSHRDHYWGDRTPPDKFKLTAPEGKHITSFYGRASGGHAGWGGLFSHLGVYWDNGAANAQWAQIAGGPGVEVVEFDYQVCTTASNSQEVSVSHEWSVSALTETSFGFELDGMKSQQKMSITRSEAQSITAGTKSSFETTKCDNAKQTCADGLHYAFQFQFTSNFDGKGEKVTKTNHWACSDKSYVCCLPDDFIDPTDAMKGCKEGKSICDPDPAPAPGPEPAPAPGPDPAPVQSAGVQSTASGLCVDLPGGDTTNGALLWMWDCYGGDTQKWFFHQGQWVYLPDPTKCVDLLGGDTTNGNRLGLWDCSAADSQQWGFDPDMGTIYLASSTASDATKCAQIGGENNGDALVVWDCTSDANQDWAVGASPAPQSSQVVV